ncbi:MAG TPA: LysR family transcriptional regulator [Roseiarcus sp.]|nr:LysR family transcriptional regulator [Roseiarcus sp.]
MREVNLAGVDLNLLPALEALIRRRNVTLAGRDIGLSQPAMSRALARLRALLGDSLLVKAPGGLAPTARAEALLPQLSASLDRLGGVLRPPAFAPEALDRVFRIVATDVHALLIGPPLLAAVRQLAPRARLSFVPISADVRERIQTGDIDLAFATATMPLPPGVHSEPLFEERLALVARRDAFPEDKAWTLAEYTAANHATVAIFGDRASEIDAELAQAGLARRIVFTSPHFLATLAAVAASDCVTTLSATLARRFADTLGLALYEPPLRQKTLTGTMVVAATRADDPGLVWLRQRVRQAARKAYRE